MGIVKKKDMLFQIDRQFENQQIRIPVRVREKSRLVVKVKHYRKPYTYYFDTAPVITGEDAILVKIPKMPPSVIMELYNDKNGNTQYDSSFQVGNIASTPIIMNFSNSQIVDSTVSSFAKFSDDFAENAGILSAQNSIYVSPNGKHLINYVDVIRDDKGREMRTPARTRMENGVGVIEIAKKYYVQHTVPGRKWTNWHEFSHLWRNVEEANELEADKNAIMIYLALGNPVVEAYNGVYRIFRNTPSNINRMRYDELNKFIRNASGKLNNQRIAA